LPQTWQATVSAAYNNGCTALHLAAQAGRTAVVQQLLLGAQADGNVADSKGWTPLHLPAHNGHNAVAQALPQCTCSSGCC